MKSTFFIIFFCFYSFIANSQNNKKTDNNSHTLSNYNILDNYVGVYAGDNKKEIIVNRDENNLYMTIPGAKHLWLTQISEHKFKADEIIVTFICDKNGKATEYQTIKNGKVNVKKRLETKVLRKTIVELSENIYNEYIGTYKVFFTLCFDVKKGNKCLIVEDPDGKAYKFFPLSKSLFFCKEYEYYVEFKRNDEGKVEELIFYRDEEVKATKKS